MFVSVRDADKPRILPTMRMLAELGFQVVATGGTQRFLEENGVKATRINKVLEGRPHVVDAIKNGEIQLVFNTTEGARRALGLAARCAGPPSCIRCPTTPLLPARSRRPRASRPIWAAISRCGALQDYFA